MQPLRSTQPLPPTQILLVSYSFFQLLGGPMNDACEAGAGVEVAEK